MTTPTHLTPGRAAATVRELDRLIREVQLLTVRTVQLDRWASPETMVERINEARSKAQNQHQRWTMFVETRIALRRAIARANAKIVSSSTQEGHSTSINDLIQLYAENKAMREHVDNLSNSINATYHETDTNLELLQKQLEAIATGTLQSHQTPSYQVHSEEYKVSLAQWAKKLDFDRRQIEADLSVMNTSGIVKVDLSQDVIDILKKEQLI